MIRNPMRWIIFVAFFVLHGFIFWKTPFSYDVRLFAEKALVNRYAMTTSESVYQLFEEYMINVYPSSALEQFQSKRIIEYPPLAVWWMTLPSLTLTPPTPNPEWKLKEILPFVKEYVNSYKNIMLVIDFLLFLCVFAGICLLKDRQHVAAERAALFILGTFILGNLLLTRLDLLLSFLICLAFILLISNTHYFFSFFVLSLGIGFKLTPIVFAPFWVFGSLPFSIWEKRKEWIFYKTVIYRSSLLGGFAFLSFLPFFYGTEAFGFLSYHANRPPQIESLWASIMLFLRSLGADVVVINSYGSWNLDASFAHGIKSLASLSLTGGLLSSFVFVFHAAIRTFKISENSPQSTASLAQIFPNFFASSLCLVMSIAIAASHVFSPQYLLWLVPFVALGFSGFTFERRRIFVVFLTILFLSTLIFPYFYGPHIVHNKAGPTAFGLFLLWSRNGLFAYLISEQLRYISHIGVTSRSAPSVPSYQHFEEAA